MTDNGHECVFPFLKLYFIVSLALHNYSLSSYSFLILLQSHSPCVTLPQYVLLLMYRSKNKFWP